MRHLSNANKLILTLNLPPTNGVQRTPIT